MKASVLFVAACLALGGCVHTVAPDGTRTTRADGKTIKTLGGSALRLYMQSQGVPVGNLYHQGETIQAPRQTYSKTHGVNFGVPPGWSGKLDQWEAAGRPPFAPEDIPADWVYPAPVVSPRQ